MAKRFRVGALSATFVAGLIVNVSGGQNLQNQSQSANWQVVECEGVDNCTTWTFVGSKGYAKWRTGEEAVLDVEVKDQQIIVTRADIGGPKRGLTATYTGTTHGNGRVAGEYRYVYQGHSDSDDWYWKRQKDAVDPPIVMRVCANPSNWNECSTWAWNRDHYDGWREWGASAAMTIQNFTRDSVVIDRTDTGAPGPGHPGAGFTMVYRGTISPSGDSILDGISVGPDGRDNPFRAYWGAALSKLPPSTSPMQFSAGSTVSMADVGATIHTLDEAVDILKFLRSLSQ